MNRNTLAALILVATCGTVTPALALEPDECLDCHEPAEDWEGMSADEILAEAKNPEIKRHKDHAGASDDELKTIIEALMAK